MSNNIKNPARGKRILPVFLATAFAFLLVAVGPAMPLSVPDDCDATDGFGKNGCSALGERGVAPVLCTIKWMDEDGKTLLHEEKVAKGQEIMEYNGISQFKWVDDHIRSREWIGFTRGMTAERDETFRANYFKPCDRAYYVEKSFGSCSGNLTAGDIANYKAIIKEGEGVNFAFSDGWVKIGFKTLNAFNPSSDHAIKLEKKPNPTISEEIADKIDGRPVYKIELGNLKNFDEKLIITLRYALKEGENPDDLAVWYIKDDGKSYDRIDAKYIGGFVTFETNHLSYYAVVNDPAPASAGGSNAAIIAGAVIAIIAVLVVALYMFKRDLLLVTIPEKIRNLGGKK